VSWNQNYDPLGWWPLSTLISALPVVTLFFVLLVLRKRVWVSAFCGFMMAVVLAAAVLRMPAPMIAAAGVNGFVFGFFRIAWIVIASIYLYNVAVETGQFQVMKESIAGVSSDRRLQVILIAFCFGAFLEGCGGGGAPVAIAGAFLIGLGFPHFQAATLCLLANTAPVAWGGVGNPVRVLNGVTGLPISQLNAMIGRILPPFSFILPAWLQFYWSNYQQHDPGLVDIVAAVFSLLVMVAFLRFWRPKHLMEEGEGERTIELRNHSVGTILKGWSPFALASVFIFLWGQPGFARNLQIPLLTFPTPWLHNVVIRTPPVTPVPTPEAASIDLNFFALPGTAVFLGAFLAALLLGVNVGGALRLLGRTFRQLVSPLLAISFMVGLAYITRYSGMDTVLGLSLTRTGWIYPFFGTLLGWLGVALTGTDAGSNALFGNLQKVTAEQLGISPVLMTSANSAGGVMGKMIDAQSIVVASTACRLEGREAEVWKAVFRHSLVLASLVGLVVLVYAYLLPWVIPG
jgi:lactate permease